MNTKNESFLIIYVADDGTHRPVSFSGTRAACEEYAEEHKGGYKTYSII